MLLTALSFLADKAGPPPSFKGWENLSYVTLLMYERITDWNREGELLCIHCYTNFGTEMLFESSQASLVCPARKCNI